MNKTLQTLFVCVFLSIVSSMQAQSLNDIESVEYDPINNRFLVSNGSNIVVVDDAGEPVSLFGTSATASHGMEVMGSNLFVIDGSVIRAYDLTSGEQNASITIAGAQFLNGMACDDDHRIWVTDFSAKKIYEIDFTELSNPTYTQVVSNTVTTPNGICYDESNNRLVFVNWGSNAKIKAVDLETYTLSTLVENTGIGNIDGIDNDSYGNYYISSWTPNRITRYNSDFSVSEIITSSDLSSPADICYAESIDKIAIPNSGNNTVKIIAFESSTGVSELTNPWSFNCFPNPVKETSVITLELLKSENIKLEVIDQQGRVVQELFDENLSSGKHKFSLRDLQLSSGAYIWRMSNGESEYLSPFIY